jgi:hypothetical protein
MSLTLSLIWSCVNFFTYQGYSFIYMQQMQHVCDSSVSHVFCLKSPHCISSVLTQCTGYTYFLSNVWLFTVLHSLTFLKSFLYVYYNLNRFTVHAYNCSSSDGPVSAVSVICGLPQPSQKNWKIKGIAVYKFQNTRQARMGCNMVKSSSPHMPSTWLIFLCPCTHAKMSESLTFVHTRERESTL